MELLGATVTHVGNVRESNQDRGHFGGYVAVVADGMGGHQGGETAATIAISEFVGITDPVGPSGLVELVEDANRAVFERAADPDLRGMGTTLVALTLRPAEGKISVVNVGDSRAYVVDGHSLQQLTNDHSLVEDLVRQKRLTPEEAAHHPQRNILTRALGISSHVEVDQFLRQTRIGDRFLLCSDGLFNEVAEEDILRILTSYASPLEAAQILVASALSGAGRDNITVVVVDVVEDGHGGSLTPAAEANTVPAMPAGLVDTDPAALSGAGADTGQGGGAPPPAGGVPNGSGAPAAGRSADAGQSHRPPSLARPAGTVLELDTPSAAGTAGLEQQPTVKLGGPGLGLATRAVPAPDSVVAAAEIANEPPGGYATFEPDALEPRRGRRAFTLVALGVLLGAVAAAAYLGVGFYNRSIWFVKQVDGGQVVIFNGRPGGLLWLEPEQQPVGGPKVDELIPEARDEVAQQPTFKSEAEARAFVDSLTLATEMVKDPAAQLGGVEASTTVPADPNATTTAPPGGVATVSGSVGAASGAAPASPASTDQATANVAGSSTTSTG